MKTRVITEKEFFDRPLFDKATYDRIMAKSARRVQEVVAQLKSGEKLKGVKLTPQEWIEASKAVGGFRPAPPPQPFLVPRRRKGRASQQMEFAFEGPQVVPDAPKKRRKVSPASARKKNNSDGGGAA